MPLNIIFAGTPEFAAVSLKTLLESSHTVCAVYTQPDRPSGRGRKLTPSPVKKLALEREIPVFQPGSLLKNGTPPLPFGHPPPQGGEDKSLDLMVVVAYGQLLPRAILDTPKYGCINIHASLLPRWRGAAPIERALEAGDKMTGVTIMQMDEHLDTGDSLYQTYCPIQANDTAQTLTERLSAIGAEALLKALNTIENGTVTRTPQNHNEATYAHKINKQEAQLDWQLSAPILARKIRAFNPRPVAFTELNGQLLRVWEARELDSKTSATPGTVISANKMGIDVATSSGVLRLLKIQAPGGKALRVEDFLKGHPFL